MDWIYVFIIVVLGVLAVSDIIVGVTNDAVNFLNSAFGSKVACRRVIIGVAAIGIMLGVLTSSGMMEVARNGVFYPEKFIFTEIILIFLGVMLADVILLNIFNTLGLPTSTTVSLVFELLGASVAVALHRIKTDPQLSASDISQFINSGKALVIISAILISVVVAFAGGIIIMYISRLIFSFRYKKTFARYGAIWSGISITGIIYFAVFKGLKSSGIFSAETMSFITENIKMCLLVVWAVCSIVLFVLQKFHINILKITILAGTFALALAFAGNDLVNFIGVPLAGYDSYQLAKETGNLGMTMESLIKPAKADFMFLFAAGIVMVLTLFFSKKAMHVTETELKLSSKNEGDEKFGSTFVSRGLVRFALSANKWYDRIVPNGIKRKIDNRFIPANDDDDGRFYDLIRGTVNLMSASILISLGTSLKLPLSTTYVTFMVAMGTSLADRAWGRESAVYRITGVMAVISGWFITALGGFLISFIVAFCLVWGGKIAIVAVSFICGYIVIRNNFFKKKKNSDDENEKQTPFYDIKNAENALLACNDEVSASLDKVTKIYNRTMVAVLKENRKVLRNMVKDSDALYEESKQKKYQILPTLQRLQNYDIDTWHFYVQVTDYISEVSKALLHITRPCFEHIDNNHEGFNREQTADLMRVNDNVETIYNKVHEMLASKNFDDLDVVLKLRDSLFAIIAEAIKNELRRVRDNNSTHTRASALYFNILSETKTMVLQYRNLLKSQRYFMEQKKKS